MRSLQRRATRETTLQQPEEAVAMLPGPAKLATWPRPERASGRPSSAPWNCEIGLEPLPTRRRRKHQPAWLVGSEKAIPPIDKNAVVPLDAGVMEAMDGTLHPEHEAGIGVLDLVRVRGKHCVGERAQHPGETAAR